MMSGSTMGYRRGPVPQIVGTAILLAGLLSGCQSPDSTSGDKVASATPKSSTGAPPKMLGLKPHDVEQLLGMPKLVRRDDPAEVWQYRSDACVLDVHLSCGDGRPGPLPGSAHRGAEPRAPTSVDDIRRTNWLPT
jgi:hypothetical protein